jgi:hypothetical protein
MSIRLSVWMVVCALAGACGSVSADNDASPSDQPDADPNAPDADPNAPDAQTTGPLTVTVYQENGSPQSGVSVVFQKADGSVVQRLMTDGDGEASSTVDAGDQVTVARVTSNNTHEVFTFVGVKPGDHLHTGQPRTTLFDQSYGQLQVQLKAFPGALSYRIDTGCPYSATPDPNLLAKVDLYAVCHDPNGVVPVYATAYDELGRAIAYEVGSLGGGGVGSLSMGDAWRTDFTTASFTVTDTPIESPLYPHVYLDTAPAPETWSFDPTLPVSPTAGENVNGTAVLPKQLGTGYIYDVEQYYYAGVQTQYRLLSQRKSGAIAASLALDGDDLLPYITGRGLVGTGDPTRPKLTWTVAASLGGADGGIVQTSWYDGNAQVYHVWSLAVPPGATEVKLPALPDSLADFRPTADLAPREPDVVVLDSDALAGYDAFRQVARSYPYAGGNVFRPLAGAGNNARLRATYVGIAESVAPPRPRNHR